MIVRIQVVRLHLLLLLSASCSSPSDNDATVIATYIEVLFHHGLSASAEWHANAIGYSGQSPWQRNGPRPEPGTCVYWRHTRDVGEVILPPPDPLLTVEGLGTHKMIRYPGGLLELEGGRTAFPTEGFLAPGTRVTFALDDERIVTTDVPGWPELVTPQPTTTLKLKEPVRIEWRPQGEEHVSLVIAFLTDAYGFLGAMNCNVPDTGAYDLVSPADSIEPQVTRVAVQLRTEHLGKVAYGDVQLELFVRQYHSSYYAASLE